MKKLREILEGEVIDLASRRKSYHKPPENPNPEILTRQEINKKLDGIVNKDSTKWNNSGITVKDSRDHSIQMIAHHIGMNGEQFYGDNTNSINLFNKRKQIAIDIYHANRKDIDNHVSDTLRSLEALHNQATSAKFPDESQMQGSILDIKRHLFNWNRIREHLSKAN